MKKEDLNMEMSLAEEFQRRMDLSDKSLASSLELSKEFASGKLAASGILVEGNAADPYQFLEDSSADDADSDR